MAGDRDGSGWFTSIVRLCSNVRTGADFDCTRDQAIETQHAENCKNNQFVAYQGAAIRCRGVKWMALSLFVQRCPKRELPKFATSENGTEKTLHIQKRADCCKCSENLRGLDQTGNGKVFTERSCIYNNDLYVYIAVDAKRKYC